MPPEPKPALRHLQTKTLRLMPWRRAMRAAWPRQRIELVPPHSTNQLSAVCQCHRCTTATHRYAVLDRPSSVASVVAVRIGRAVDACGAPTARRPCRLRHAWRPGARAGGVEACAAPCGNAGRMINRASTAWALRQEGATELARGPSAPSIAGSTCVPSSAMLRRGSGPSGGPTLI